MRQQNGFTVIEVLIAVVILSVGVIGLVGTAALVTRMIAQGQRYTEAASIANDRFERLRAVECDSMAAGSATPATNYTARWTVTTVSGGNARQVTLVVESPTGEGFRVDSFTTTRFC